MRAIVMRAPGGPAVLELRDVPEPRHGAEEILVDVRAAGVNQADVIQRKGHYPAPAGWPADVPGLEYAGVVAAAGSRVRRWRVGDRVMGLVGGGGYAERVVVHEREALPIPLPLSFEEAAALPEAFITAHDALFTRLHVASGERVLIHAVGSGVGTAATQLAAAAGVVVIGTPHSRWKLERCESLGVRHGVAAADGEWVSAVRALAPEEGVHAVLELVGGDYLPGDLEVIAELGRIALVGLVAGRSTQLDLAAVLRKRVTITGTTLRYRPIEEKIAATRAVERHVLPLCADGRVRPVVDRVLAFDAAPEAHRCLEANEIFGKLVLHVAD
jgi:NADPH:quinone reductase